MHGKTVHADSSDAQPNQESALLPMKEVAKILHVSLSTLYLRVQAGDLEAVKLGPKLRRVRRTDLDRYIASLSA